MVERLRGLLAGARADRDRVAADLEATRGELAKARAELVETEAWLRELEGSRSWRLTAPLRGLGGGVRRWRGRGRARED